MTDAPHLRPLRFFLAGLVALAVACNGDSPSDDLTDGGTDRPSDDQGGDLTLPEPLTLTITAEPQEGTIPLEVAFFAEAMGGQGEILYTWDFGDGTTGTGQEPSHLYQEDGLYTVTASATDEQGASMVDDLFLVLEKSLSLTVVADAIPRMGPAPLVVAFLAAARGASPPVVFEWDFGDGQVSFGSQILHTYREQGLYQATLSISDRTDQTQMLTIPVEVTERDTLPDAFLLVSSTEGNAPLSVHFQALVEGGDPPLTYLWDFGDGQTSELAEVVHTFTAPGFYEVTFFVEDKDGDRDDETVTILVYENLLPTAEASVTPSVGVTPLTVTCSGVARAGDPPYSYLWDFGQGETATEAETTHIYREAGTHEITFTVWDRDGDQDSLTFSVEAQEDSLPLVSAQASVTQGIVPLTVALSALVEGGNEPIQVEWDFGDGLLGQGLDVEHIYYDAGEHRAVVTVRDGDGDEALAEVVIVALEDLKPEATAYGEPLSGQVPLDVAFWAEVVGGNEPLAFLWDFGDGQTSEGPEATHTYTRPGSHTVTLRVTDADLDESRSQLVVKALPASPVEITAQADPMQGPAPLAVQFSYEVAGGVAPFIQLWEFGLPDTSNEAAPVYQYQIEGTYTVTLTVTDAEGSTGSDQLIIQVDPPDLLPLASVQADPVTGPAPLIVAFSGQASGGNRPLSYSWDFGDGTQSSSASVTHTYLQGGTFLAVMTVTDIDGDEDSASVIIRVVEDLMPLVTAQAEPVTGPAPLSVSFTSTVEGGDPPVELLWDFGDNITTTVPNPTHVYDTAGTYSVTLTATDADGDQGQDSLVIEVTD